MLKFIIALGFITETLAAYGDLRINGGGDSGKLEFQKGGTWGAVCRTFFDDDAGDVACRQLGYLRSTDVFTYDLSYYNTEDIAVCDVFCYGDEDRLTDCDLTTNPDLCSCSSGTVGITCTNTLSTGAIIGIVLGVLLFVASVATVIILFVCCLVPTCPCYYRSHRATSTVIVTQPAAPQVVTTMGTAISAPPYYTTTYKPVPPTATTISY